MKYTTKFVSKNEPVEQFTLSWFIVPAFRKHAVANVECYQHLGDVFCQIKERPTGTGYRATIQSIRNYLCFDIEILVNPNHCEVFVLEKVITTISHIEALQPCKI